MSSLVNLWAPSLFGQPLERIIKRFALYTIIKVHTEIFSKMSRKDSAFK